MLKKASKRLVTAIIALVASVILCIGVCLAWFAVNNEVRGDGLRSELRGDDIVSLTVKAYYLNETEGVYEIAADGDKYADGSDITDSLGTAISVDVNGDGVINYNGDAMRPFAYGNYTTAVLFKIDYELLADSAKTFRIFAECPSDTADTRLTVENNNGKFTSKLSNAVKFYEAESGTGYIPAPVADTFVNDEHEKSFKLDFYDGITVGGLTVNAAGNKAGTAYLIMDYDSDRFSYLSSLVLENGGNLNSGLELTGDITLGMEEYDPAETVTPESIEADGFAPAAFYTQQASADNEDLMSHSWQFVVTYSDGTEKIIKVSGNHDGLVISGLDTTAMGKFAGSNGATVTYMEGGVTLTCKVDYEIGIVISGGSVVAVGDSLQLTAVGAGDRVITWRSDNTAVATVQNGTVTGVAAGTATITAEVTSDGDTYTAAITVTVAEKSDAVAVTGVTLSRTALTLKEGETATLTATVAPDNATNKTVTWTSSDTAVAKVGSNGAVTAVAAGSANITVTTSDGNHTAVCKVTVEKADTTVAVTGVTLDKATATLKMGETVTVTLTAAVTPENATDKTVTWTSSDAGIATVENGVVTAVAAGSAIITVTTSDGNKTATCEVTVEAASAGGDAKIYSEELVALTANGDTTADGVITVRGGSFEEKTDGVYEYGGVNYTSCLRAGGSNRYIEVNVTAGQKVTVLFGGNVANKAASASIQFADADGNAIGESASATNAGVTANGILTHTFTESGTYRIVCDNNKPCIFAVIIET